ncbi:FCD domain-containing protein [Bradyrhizobium sp. KBS0727]|uniref:FCD domain-containing protein n=1 Tax=unclassified Bradyrhizobium TaxID=2631580 RepID=UPI00110D8991|nr:MULTISPECIES: FCD domain-containing protein [unclassified Bradyrhizobium]QDW40561.1 FCD domain-containing protein [Bradyrhizobium sp. KBS0725]QDW47166.1 FCD domain-containing protein [Bradyrhizobium sp. KBS0727]
MSVDLEGESPSPVQFLGQEVLENIRWDILKGTFEPNTKLPFALLQSRYGLSIGTIREALSHLVSDRLVHLDAGRGFRVAPVSKADLIEISELRVDFEKRALESAMSHGDERWEVKIISAFDLLEKMERSPLSDRLTQPGRWNRLHREFHAALVSACRSRWLLQFRALLFDQADRYRLRAQLHQPTGSSRDGEHRAIMDAVLARDAVRAVVLAEQHIRSTVDELLRYEPQLQ